MNMQQQIDAGEYDREIIADGTALALVSRQEIDTQIATAHKFPRSVRQFQQDVTDLTTRSVAIAAECSYALPRDGKLIEGPSIRFAEALIFSWGNCRTAARIMGDDGSFVIAQGMFHDLQKNSAVSFEVRRRILDRNGKRYGADMIGVTGNAAAAIALRNAVLHGVPKAFWNELWEAARRVAKGDHKTLPNRRAEAVKMFQGYGVSSERLLAFLGLADIADIDTDHLMVLRGMVQAFRDNESTPEQIFGDPQAKPKPAGPRPIADRLDDFAQAGVPYRAPEAAAARNPAAVASAPRAPQPPRAAGADAPKSKRKTRV